MNAGKKFESDFVASVKHCSSHHVVRLPDVGGSPLLQGGVRRFEPTRPFDFFTGAGCAWELKSCKSGRLEHSRVKKHQVAGLHRYGGWLLVHLFYGTDERETVIALSAHNYVRARDEALAGGKKSLNVQALLAAGELVRFRKVRTRYIYELQWLLQLRLTNGDMAYTNPEDFN